MTLPLAVAPSVRSPGLAISVNLLAGTTSPSQGKKALVLATKSTSSGTITPDTQLVQGLAGPDDAKTYLGAGNPGHLAIKRMFEEYGLAQCDLAAPTESVGNASTQTVIFDSTAPVTVAQIVVLTICGRDITFVWAAGRTGIQAATDMVTAILALDADLPVTPSNAGGASATLTLTFKIKGTIGNDVVLALTFSGGAGGACTLTGTSMTGGTVEANFSTVLTLVAGQEYDYILLVSGNTDADNASATSNVGKTKTAIDAVNSGFNAKLQQIIVGVTGTLANAKTGTAQHDYGPLAYTLCNAGRSLGCEFGGAELGARMRETTNKGAAANRINLAYSKAQLFGPKDLVANALTAVQVEDALQSGVTPITYTAQGVPRISRPITTYFKDASGNPDDRILDQCNVDGVFTVAKDLRSFIPQKFAGLNVIADQATGSDPLPDGVVEEKDVKAEITARMRFWINRGVVRADKFNAALLDGTFIVKVDPTDGSQLDVVLPIAIIKPWAKTSLVLNKVA